MKFYVFFLFLFLINITSPNHKTNCSQKSNPKTKDECQISLVDKIDYKYCCFVNRSDVTSCNAYTQSDYEILKEYLRVNKSNITFECNSSVYLQILIIHILLFIF